MAVQTIADEQMFVGGEWVAATGGEWVEVRNPATGEVVARVLNFGAVWVNDHLPTASEMR